MGRERKNRCSLYKYHRNYCKLLVVRFSKKTVKVNFAGFTACFNKVTIKDSVIYWGRQVQKLKLYCQIVSIYRSISSFSGLVCLKFPFPADLPNEKYFFFHFGG